MNLKLILFKSLKVGLVFNIFTLTLLVIYVLFVEHNSRQFDFKHSVELGTAVRGGFIFNTADPLNYQTFPPWSAVEPKFSLFVPEFQFRADWKQPSPRIEKWCKTRNCCVHRIGFNDKRKFNFKCFTLDDWFITNRDFLGSDLDSAVVLALDNFLRSLPVGSRIIVSEPAVLFSNKNSFYSFKNWILALAAKHPRLRFQVGLQIHLQWVDSFWFDYHWLFPELAQLSKEHRISWGVSEFSIYDRIWKRRISFAGSIPDRAKFSTAVESLFPDRLRRAVVLHQAYLLHRGAVFHGAQFVVEWGNFPSLWFSDRIDPDYKSTFTLFDWQGNPQPMYWAIARGIQDGEKAKKNRF